MLPECFADEIAIDFPSVGRVVDRMRDRFLGEARPDVLTLDVSLSSREACVGGVVPVELPIRGACLSCGGRGETWTERCDSCRGTGDAIFPHVVRVPLPRGVADGACVRFRVNSPQAGMVRVELRIAVRSSAA
jgi:DnaJ-class molecular chaperone